MPLGDVDAKHFETERKKNGCAVRDTCASHAEASGSSLMPPTSTQNALFVCNEADEPDDGSGTPLKKLFSNKGSSAQHAGPAPHSAVPSMVPASHNTQTAEASGSRDGVTAESCRVASGSMESSGAQIRRGVGSLRSEVANAVTQLQDALRSDLQEDQLEVYDVLGRGGFGTVYYGALPGAFACPCRNNALAGLPVHASGPWCCSCPL